MATCPGNVGSRRLDRYAKLGEIKDSLTADDVFDALGSCGSRSNHAGLNEIKVNATHAETVAGDSAPAISLRNIKVTFGDGAQSGRGDATESMLTLPMANSLR